MSDPVEGTSYLRTCVDETGAAVGGSEFVIYQPAPPDPAVVAAALAQRALAELVLPTPTVTSNPPNGLAVINVPVWFWVGDWSTLTATAAAGGVSATVSAAPQQVRWDTGDGHKTTCPGPGTPYDAARPPTAQHTSCSHTYTDHTGDLTVTAIETWHVTYTATNGESGDLGLLTRTATLPEHVHQLVTAIRGD